MCFFRIVKLYTAKIKWKGSFDKKSKSLFELIKRLIETFMIISAVFTYF